MSRDDQNRHRRNHEIPVASQDSQEFASTKRIHHPVEQNDIRLPVDNKFECFGAVACLKNRSDTESGQYRAQNGAHMRIVFRNQAGSPGQIPLLTQCPISSKRAFLVHRYGERALNETYHPAAIFVKIVKNTKKGGSSRPLG